MILLDALFRRRLMADQAQDRRRQQEREAGQDERRHQGEEPRTQRPWGRWCVGPVATPAQQEPNGELILLSAE